MELTEVKEALYKKELVEYDESSYTITAYILRFDGKEFKHLLELKDLKAKSSVIIVDMKKVEFVEKSIGINDQEVI